MLSSLKFNKFVVNSDPAISQHLAMSFRLSSNFWGDISYSDLSMHIANQHNGRKQPYGISAPRFPTNNS
ncbi:hypothetical protein WUBG_10288 [Wuchereria bancrofti]|uniref:Uncharacterized protein n=1 Tax=Wuchereria bancrofti TaxID=6293 RepID=J9EP30_WUCBA|nr:hypothetical protein WUBG_10288 [Wuchereria bancrofti]